MGRIMALFQLNRWPVAVLLGLIVVFFAGAGETVVEPETQLGLEKIAAGALVVDVRASAEFNAGHFEGAINIPHDQLAARLNELGAELDQPIVTYCRSGRRAGIAVQILHENGYSDVTNGGGLQALLKQAAVPSSP